MAFFFYTTSGSHNNILHFRHYLADLVATRDVEQAQASQYSKLCRSASGLLQQQHHDYSPTVSHDQRRGINSQNHHNWTNSQALQERLINQGMYNPTLSSPAQPPAAGLCRSVDSLCWENHANHHQQVRDIDHHLMYTSDNPVMINHGQQEQELYYSNIPCEEDVLHLGSLSSSSRFSHGKGSRSKVRVNPSTPAGRSLIDQLMPAPAAAGKKLIMEEILADGLTLTLCSSRADPAPMSFT